MVDQGKGHKRIFTSLDGQVVRLYVALTRVPLDTHPKIMSRDLDISLQPVLVIGVQKQQICIPGRFVACRRCGGRGQEPHQHAGEQLQTEIT